MYLDTNQTKRIILSLFIFFFFFFLSFYFVSLLFSFIFFNIKGERSCNLPPPPLDPPQFFLYIPPSTPSLSAIKMLWREKMFFHTTLRRRKFKHIFNLSSYCIIFNLFSYCIIVIMTLDILSTAIIWFERIKHKLPLRFKWTWIPLHSTILTLWFLYKN